MISDELLAGISVLTVASLATVAYLLAGPARASVTPSASSGNTAVRHTTTTPAV